MMRNFVLAGVAVLAVASAGGTAFAVHASSAASSARTKAGCVAVEAELAPLTQASEKTKAAWLSASQRNHDATSRAVVLADIAWQQALATEQQMVVAHAGCYRPVDVQVAQGEVKTATNRIAFEESRLS